MTSKIEEKIEELEEKVRNLHIKVMVLRRQVDKLLETHKRYTKKCIENDDFHTEKCIKLEKIKNIMLFWKEEEYGMRLLGDFELENLIEKAIKLTAKEIFKDIEKVLKEEIPLHVSICVLQDKKYKDELYYHLVELGEDIKVKLKKEWGVE